jgi:hypothetical protein
MISVAVKSFENEEMLMPYIVGYPRYMYHTALRNVKKF